MIIRARKDTDCEKSYRCRACAIRAHMCISGRASKPRRRDLGDERPSSRRVLPHEYENHGQLWSDGSTSVRETRNLHAALCGGRKNITRFPWIRMCAASFRREIFLSRGALRKWKCVCSVSGLYPRWGSIEKISRVSGVRSIGEMWLITLRIKV